MLYEKTQESLIKVLELVKTAILSILGLGVTVRYFISTSHTPFKYTVPSFSSSTTKNLTMNRQIFQNIYLKR